MLDSVRAGSAGSGHRRLSAEAREVYEEGLFIPILKLYEAGRPNESLMAIIRANVRLPEMVVGDFHAQMAGGAVGGERLLEFMAEFGLERLEPLADEAMREAIRGLRPGVYENAVTFNATAFPSGVLGTPAEVLENIAPLLIERRELRPDSGGPGHYRGGLGQTIAFRVRTREPYTCSVLCDRTRTPANGFVGGEPGALGEVRINGAAPANPKAEQLVPPDALVEVQLPGGGGYGPPSERDPESQARDLLEGYVTTACRTP